MLSKGQGATGAVARLEAFRQALQAGDAAAAEQAFAALCGMDPPDPGFAAWLRAGCLAFRGPEDDPVPMELGQARADPAGRRRLFAHAAFGAGHPAVAIEAARHGLASGPPDGTALLLLCALLLKRGDPEAQSRLQEALAGAPGPARGWTDIGAVLLAAGKREAALLCLARGIPSPALALRRGQLAREIGRLDAARAAFEEAVRLAPASPRAWFLLGLCAQDQHDLAAAAAAYRSALARDPGLAEAAVNLGTVLQEGGDLAAARAAYGEAIATRPGTFGRIAQALSTAPTGELWLDLEALRRSLAP